MSIEQLEISYETSTVIFCEKPIYYNFIKRVIDILGALFGIVLLSPIMLIAAVAIKMDSEGSIFFIQDRVGQNGRIFKMFKFRTMVIDAEELREKLAEKNEMSYPMFKIKEDPRITKVGKVLRKTSIDELPQFFNVLRGEMSLVGPRPNLPMEVNCFTEYHKQKLLVKPGLTCYWQVMGRNNIDFEDWIRLDLKYIEERSISVDLNLIFKTIKLLIRDKNGA